MAAPYTLDSNEIREIGEALYGAVWQGEMARAIGVPRQSVGYYLKAGGVNGAQAAAIIGLVARTLASEKANALVFQAGVDARHADLTSLLVRFESR